MRYKIYSVLLALVAFGFVLGCKKDDKDKEASAPPRVLPQFSSASFESKVPDLLSYEPPKTTSSLVLPKNLAAIKLLSATPLAKAVLAQETPAKLEKVVCPLGEEWKSDKDRVRLRALAKESAGYVLCNLEDLEKKVMVPAKTKLQADGERHVSDDRSYYIYKTNMQDGELQYNSLELGGPNLPFFNVVWSDQSKRVAVFSVSFEENDPEQSNMVYLEAYQKGEDLYLSTFESLGQNLYDRDAGLWMQVAYDSVSGAYRLIEADASADEKDATTTTRVVRGNTSKQVAGVRAHVVVQGKDATDFFGKNLFGTFTEKEAEAKVALTDNISERTLDVFDPALFSQSDQSLKSKSELRQVLLARFKALKVPVMKGSFYTDDKEVKPNPEPPPASRVLPQFNSANFESKLPDLLSYVPSAPSPLVLSKNLGAYQPPNENPGPRKLLAREAPAKVEDEGCKTGTEWYRQGAPTQLKLMAKESIGFTLCNVDAAEPDMETIKGSYILDGKEHPLEGGGTYIYKANIQAGDLQYNSLEVSRPTLPFYNVLWSDQSKRMALLSVSLWEAPDGTMKNNIFYLEGYQKADDLYLSSYLHVGKNLYDLYAVFWEHATYNSTSGAYRLLEGMAASAGSDATAAAVVVRGNVNKQIAGARLRVDIQGKDATSKTAGDLFGTFDAAEAKTKLALTANITDSTLDVFDPALFSQSDKSLKSNPELRAAVLTRFKALKVPVMQGDFYQ